MTQEDLAKVGQYLYQTKVYLEEAAKLCFREKCLEKHGKKLQFVRLDIQREIFSIGKSIEKMIEKEKGPRDNLGSNDDEVTIEPTDQVRK